MLALMSQARKIALCADIWSKKGLTSSYLGVTAHFFSRKDHRKHVVTLSVKRMPSPHTAVHVREKVEEVLHDWELSADKVSLIITDSGSNMVAAFRNLVEKKDDTEEEDDQHEEEDEEGDNYKDELDEEVDDFETKEIDHDITFSVFISRLSCFSHSLQLVVRRFDEVSSYRSVLKRVRALIRRVNMSTKATEKLISLCRKKLLKDCPTRWSSTFLVIERLLQVRSSLSTVLNELEWDDLPTSDWKQLENIYTLLKPFAQYTSLVSGEEYTTLSSIIPVVTELSLHLEEMKKNREVSEAATVLLTNLKQRFRKYTDLCDPYHCPLYLAATCLDPRYKLLLNPTQLNSAKKEILKLLKEESKNGGSSASSKTASPAHDDPSDEPPLKRFCHLSRLLEEKWKEGVKRASEESKQPAWEQQLDNYLKSIQPVEHPDPVAFWLDEEVARDYSQLSVIAIDLLIVPGSSAPVERTFSTAGDACSGKRNRLTDKNLEREVLIRKNKQHL